MHISSHIFSLRLVCTVYQDSTANCFSHQEKKFYVEVLMAGTVHLKAQGQTLKARKFFGTSEEAMLLKVCGYANKLLAGRWLTDEEYNALYGLASDRLTAIWGGHGSDKVLNAG